MANIRPLSTDLQKIATTELNEKEERIPEDIQHIRDWLKKQPHLNIDWDDQWIVTFLRGCKYSLEKTKTKIDLYCSVRTYFSEFFISRYPFSAILNRLRTLSSMSVLPRPEYPPKPKICLLRFENCDDGVCTFVDCFRFFLMAIDATIGDDDHVAVCGVEIIIDYAHFGLNYTFQITPVLLHKIITILEKSYPFRIKGIYTINVPTVVEALFPIGKQFMSSKIKERLFMYGPNSIDELYKHIPKDVMPKEYGGKNPSVQILADELNKKIESYGKQFLDDEKYFSIERLRPVNHKSPNDIFNMQGSFRKLEVD